MKYLFSLLIAFSLLCPAQGQDVIISGQILNVHGAFQSGVNVSLLEQNSGQFVQAIVTSNDGRFEFQPVPAGNTYTIKADGGLTLPYSTSMFQIVTVMRHILGIAPLESPLLEWMADFNNSGSVSTLDAVAMQRAILSIDTPYQDGADWVLVPTDYDTEGGEPMGISITPATDVELSYYLLRKGVVVY